VIIQAPDGTNIEFPDNTPDSEIIAAMQSYTASLKKAPAPKKPAFTAAPAEGTVVPQFDTPATRASYRETMGALPTVGGMIGGAVGGPFGATAGGALGDLARQGLVGDPFSPGSAATQGALQGVLEGGGRLLAAGAGRLAGPVMRSALGGKATQEMADAALSAGTPITGGGVAKMGRQADIAEALAAFAKSGDAEAAQALADNLRATHGAMTQAVERGTPKIDPKIEALAAIVHPHSIPAIAGEALGRYAVGNPTLRSLVALRLLYDPAARAVWAQSPRALAAAYRHFTQADATAR